MIFPMIMYFKINNRYNNNSHNLNNSIKIINYSSRKINKTLNLIKFPLNKKNKPTLLFKKNRIRIMITRKQQKIKITFKVIIKFFVIKMNRMYINPKILRNLYIRRFFKTIRKVLNLTRFNKEKIINRVLKILI